MLFAIQFYPHKRSIDVLSYQIYFRKEVIIYSEPSKFIQ